MLPCAYLVFQILNLAFLSFRDLESSFVYSLRDSANKLALPLPRTNYLRSGFHYSGADL